MIYLNLTINNPWSDLFQPIRAWGGRLFKHKAWEIEIYRSETIVELEVRFTAHADHAGLSLGMGLLSYTLRAQFYDTRHWNYAEHRYQVYGDGNNT